MFKSLSAQFGLTLLFGPLGLVYSSVAAAVFLSLILAVLYFTELSSIAFLIIWPISILTGLVFVKIHNDRMRQSGSRLLLGPGEEGDLVSTVGSWGRGIAVLGLLAMVSYAAFVWVPSRSDHSRIGRIVDAPSESVAQIDTAVEVSNVSDSSDLPLATIVSVESESSLNNVTIDDQTVAPVVIDTASRPATAGTRAYVDTETLNMRSSASRSSSIVVLLDAGEAVNVIEESGKWVNVEVVKTGTTGWVYGRYLKTTQQ